ncbi:MAG: gene transfer agent family protein [Pseudomonadota bacterium]
MNPYRGDVPITFDGETHVMRLTLGALVEVEAARGSIAELVERMEAGQTTAQDVLALLAAGLRATGWEGDQSALAEAEFEDGYLGALKAAALLLKRGFGLEDPDV